MVRVKVRMGGGRPAGHPQTPPSPSSPSGQQGYEGIQELAPVLSFQFNY
jgi:hypothetical protein